MLKSTLPVATVVVAFAQVALTYWNWEQTAAMKGTFVCNISEKLALQTVYVMVDRYTPVNDPSLIAYQVNQSLGGFFLTSRIIRKMTFLPALDVYHKCFDRETTNCTCYMKFRLGPDPTMGEFSKCVSLGRKPQRLGWHQEWCDFHAVDLEAVAHNATCDHTFCGGK
ncbi:hypothetical protein AAVH_34539 [Aphelenchoides avenae]|nr:hypothetical protein AAVH_34539 [Aphelenchus avenae]